LLFVLLFIYSGCDPSHSSTLDKYLLAEATGEFAERPKFILDTDTANEIDDLYAIARLLPAEMIDLLGITSAQWFHHYSGDSTVYQSQRLNEEILALAEREELPHPIGADRIMGDPWGGYTPRPSPASAFIIKSVKAMPAGEKLVVMSIGAATNLASAIALDTSIASRIVAYTLGFQYNHKAEYWNKDEFNIRRDLNAANFLLNQENLELHIMPTSVAMEYTWQKSDTYSRLEKAGYMGQYLRDKWQERFPDSDSWVMWDVALVQAFLHPEMAIERVVNTPPENKQRQVYMYTDIDFDAMYKDFWACLAANY
ncbi:MAG: nucleoside hydrolase, partial [Bacteroidota bacterium]